MRYLVTCWPFTGHVLPQLAVADGLRKRGHEVAFYTGESAADLVRAKGFTVHPFTAVDEDDAYRCVRLLEAGSEDGRRKPSLTRRTFLQWLVEPIPAQVSDLTAIVAEWRPDVIVTDLSMWAPIVILQETTGIPVALSSTFMGPLIPGPDAPAAGFGMKPPRNAAQRAVARGLQAIVERAGSELRTRVDEIRDEHGLDPLAMSVNELTALLPLTIIPSLASLDHNRTDLPSTVHYVGPVLTYPASTPEADAWLAGIPADRPLVHVTESTLRYGDPFLLRAAIEGLPGAGYRVVATTGAHRDLEHLDLGPHPELVHVTDWVSHAALLPRCAAVVTNGGTATILSALAHGLPLVVAPTTWDKPDNARRVVESGAGISLKPSRCTPARVRDAVKELLEDPRYTHSARTIAEQLAAAPGVDGPGGAADLLEALVPSRSAR